MTVFCDRLSLAVVGQVLRRRLSGEIAAGSRILLLDGPVTGIIERLGAALLRIAGLPVAEATFFSGHLRTPDGQAVGPAAHWYSFTLADDAAQAVFERSPLLREMNARWGRDTVKLRVAKSIWPEALALAHRLFAADRLALDETKPSLAILQWPSGIPRDVIPGLPVSIEIVCAGHASQWKQGRLGFLLWLGRYGLRRLTPASDPPPSAQPTLMVLQEDDLSLDRSRRGQPHWMGDEVPRFRTLVVRTSAALRSSVSAEEAVRRNITLVDVAHLSARRPEGAVSGELRQWARRLLSEAFLNDLAPHRAAARECIRLAFAAADLSGLAAARQVTAFMTCESYMLHADAMNLVGPHIGVTTLGYQYSNLPGPSLPMTSTADRFLVFSPRFRDVFTWPGYPAPTFVSSGYLFSSSFPLLRERARERRERMRKAGATFIVGWFDESVQHSKYGWLNRDDYEQDLRFLLEAVMSEPDLGLVIKPQFHKNMEGMSADLTTLLKAAVATGRVELPSTPGHRNGVFPAEIASSCDLVLGHLFGGTASLEAALAGCRSLMIDSRPVHLPRLGIYRTANLVVSSIEDAWLAISRYRAGVPSYATLGDWGPILGQFDEYRDDKSADRMRQHLYDALGLLNLLPDAVTA